ncbi:ABC transporter permease [Spirochaeta dissipatitropha]
MKISILLFYTLLFVFIVLPLLFLVISAFAGYWPFPDILPGSWSLRAWQSIWLNRKDIFIALLVSTLYSAAAVLLSAAICWLPARFLARTQFPGQALLEAVLLTPALVPAISFSMGLQVIFIRIRLADTAAGVILILSLVSYPYMLRAMKIGYLAYRRGYDECAQNLGAGRLQRILEIEFPVLLPSALAGGSVVFLSAFSDYFLVSLIGGGQLPSFTAYLIPFINSGDRASAAALTILFISIPLILFSIQEIFLQHFYRNKGM